MRSILGSLPTSYTDLKLQIGPKIIDEVMHQKTLGPFQTMISNAKAIALNVQIVRKPQQVLSNAVPSNVKSMR